jgi:hypothetical protein
MRAFRQSTVVLASLAVAGCATHGPRPPGPPRWTGDFRQSQMAGSSATMTPATPNTRAGYGNIVLTPLQDGERRMKVDLSLTAPVPGGTQIAWAVFQGSCGAPTPPVAAVNDFPTIEVAASGGGAVRTEMTMELDPHLTYHANIYWSNRATDVSNVMMCANLQFRGGA